MLETSKHKLSVREETIAQQALKQAYEREISALMTHVRDRANSITKIEDLWYLHDLLSTKRFEIDGKYTYDFATFVFDCARLVQEGWLKIEDLQGLPSTTLSKISALARM